MPHFDIAVIGSGSGYAMLHTLPHERVALIDEAAHFGGTCLNVGCIPTKIFVHTADVAAQIRDAARFGVDGKVADVDWPAIQERVFARIDPISAGSHDHAAHRANWSLYQSRARFTGEKELTLDSGEVITAEQVFLAGGSRPVIPKLFAESSIPFHTSASIMRLEGLPRRLLIIGGGYVATEFAHIFSALGSEIVLINRNGALLGDLDHDISQTFTDLAAKRWELHLGTTVTGVDGDAAGVQLRLRDGSEVTGDAVLVAAGRRANGDLLAASVGGVALHEDGRVVVDEFQRTTAPNVWALGDVSSPQMLKHVANQDAKVVAHNITHPDAMIRSRHDVVPFAVFTDPQIASVGLTLAQAGERAVQVRRSYGSTAFGWALEDSTSFCTLVVEAASGRLLGAHILGPEASILIQPLIWAVTAGLDVRSFARDQYWIHPALTEVVENALLEF